MGYNIEKAAAAVQIDDTRLDVECVELPSLILQAGLDVAHAKRATDEAKRGLDLVQAEIRLHVRENPGRHGLEKVTEGAVGEVVSANVDVQEAIRKHNEAREDQEVHYAYLNALEAKKRTLSLLVDLHGMSYFSDVRTSKRGRESVEAEAQADVRTRKRMKRKGANDKDQWEN